MGLLASLMTEFRLWLCGWLLMAAVRAAPKGKEGDAIIIGVHRIFKEMVALNATARHRPTRGSNG